MPKALIVTDSTCDLPPHLVQELGITVVPLNIHFGEEVFLDGQTLDEAGFWAKLGSGGPHPTTSQPAPGAFVPIFEAAAQAGRPVVAIHISAQMSGTLQSAQIAQGMVSGAEVHLVDSQTVSLGLGLVVLAAARMAQEDAPAADIAARARQLSAATHILFGVDTLEFLQRGGRIGKAQALVGGLLGIKPILQVKAGEVHSADKVRGKGKVLPRVLELAAELVPHGSKVRLGVLHARNPDGAQEWLAALRSRYAVTEAMIGSIAPVVAAHAGPGTVGAVIQSDLDA